jgi:probable F420-dependent oxidoreductase
VILAALGPRMLKLARERAGGAYPFLVSTDYVRQARAILGSDRALAVLLPVTFEPDLAGAREVLRPALSFFAGSPAYHANFVRMGFGEEELTSVGERFLDAVTIWGSDDRVRERVDAYHRAGADQVVLSVARRDGAALPREEWRRLAGLFFA